MKNKILITIAALFTLSITSNAQWTQTTQNYGITI